MMFEKLFSFPIKAIPMGRPRVTSNSRKTWAYEPENCESYKTTLKLHMVREMRGIHAVDEPVVINICYYFAVPESWSNKKKLEAFMTPCVNSKDLDNLDKAVLDAMKGVVITDDHKVVALSSFKMLSPKDHIEIKVRSWEAFTSNPEMMIPGFTA